MGMTANLFAMGLLQVKRKIFVSYHHGGDQQFYNEFSRLFADGFEAVQDNSLSRAIDSDDAEYVMRTIREDYLTGTSCTIVLCGPGTRWRKFVDWEIKASLDKQHALIGVKLPHNHPDAVGSVHKPDRLQDNLDSGYAVWTRWEELARGPAFLRVLVEQARLRPKSLIDNSRPLRRRNGS
jgi:uncharacterized protein (DUF2249 family)